MKFFVPNISRGLVFVWFMLLSSVLFAADGNFKVLRAKGTVKIENAPIKLGVEYLLEKITTLSISTEDESGFVVLRYNNKNKIVLEKTFNFASLEKKRKLFETTAFKTRGNDLSSFPELVSYFQKKPFLILGDSRLVVKQSVLEFPQKGSFLDLYYTTNDTEEIHKIPYDDNSFVFKHDMFKKNEEILGPITLTMVDVEGGKEDIITEDFYVVKADTEEISAQLNLLADLNMTKGEVSECIFDWLLLKYPDYYIDRAFVEQFVKSRLQK